PRRSPTLFSPTRARNARRRPTDIGERHLPSSPRGSVGGPSMRLTLRTLLAYLDDTLEPSQAREIGQKVAESHVAQELIERIKKVTRRRGLTVPPAAGPEKIEANIVSEYLDNDLPSDKVAEVEEQALGSDVGLA